MVWRPPTVADRVSRTLILARLDKRLARSARHIAGSRLVLVGMSHPALEARSIMKQFFVLVLIGGALMVSSPGQARMVSSRPACVNACDGNGVTGATCNWISRPGKWNRCRTRVIKQCRRFGVDAMCPIPTTTTVPAPGATTTTVPYVPPTTTTLPVVTYPDLIGSYQFDGSLVDDPCGIGPLLSPPEYLGSSLTVHFSVTSEVGTSLSGTMGVYTATGSYDPSTGDWSLGTTGYYDAYSGCYLQADLGVGGSSGYLIVGANCVSLGLDCTLQYSGPVL